MANMRFYRSTANQGRGTILPYPVANSMTIRRGDWVVLADGSPNVIRKLTSTDISNFYTETNLKGLLGMAMHDVTTDSSGYASGQINPSGVASGATPIYGVPTYGAGLPADTVSGRAQCNVLIADSNTEFIILCQAASNAATTGTAIAALQNEMVGLQVYNTTDFTINTGVNSGASATGAALSISEFPLPNGLNNTLSTSSATMWYAAFRVRPTYQQYLTGYAYA